VPVGPPILAEVDISQRWFDDISVGEVFEAGPHLMEEQRIIEFAAEFDPQRFHLDPAAAKESIYGGLIASGWHTGAVLMKLLSTTLSPASLGSPGGDNLRWLAPVRPGDELRLQVTVLSKTPSSTKPDRGVLVYRNEMYNQTGTVVMSFESVMMMLRRSADG
jgi:acyl dehydratase